MTAQQNVAWQTAVRRLLKMGYGVEDISLKVSCDVQHVRNEVHILRADGELDRMFPQP